jgi:predicted ATPase
MHREINEIDRKRLTSPWPKFLKSVAIDGFRGWVGQEVKFQFPVCVLVGENGCGKSTILKAAASAYAHPTDKTKSYYPGTFFPDTPWDTISGVTLKYKISEGDTERSFAIRKKSARWRFPDNRARRVVIWQDISRTLPLEATVGYAKIAKKTAKEVATDKLSKEINSYYSNIMGRIYMSARFATSDADESRPVGIVDFFGSEYSQFHQGAGEDATLDLLALLQNVQDTSLILIDEIEASLHPRSQRRLVHFLLWLARTRHIQVIVSTHSPYIVEELPFSARIFLSRGSEGIDVIYGATPDYALNKMDDIDRPEIFLFTEDPPSTELTGCLLRDQGFDLTRVKFIEVGPANVVGMLGTLANTARLPMKAIGVLDADQPSSEGCVKLPGSSAPEIQVIKDVLAMSTNELAKRLDVREGSVKDALERASSKSDHHDWVQFAAKELGHAPSYLWATLCQIWCKHCASEEEKSAIKTKVEDAIMFNKYFE